MGWYWSGRRWWWYDKHWCKRYWGGQFRRRRNRLVVRGLPVRMQYWRRDGLHAIRCDPLPGFTHLCSPHEARRCARRFSVEPAIMDSRLRVMESRMTSTRGEAPRSTLQAMRKLFYFYGDGSIFGLEKLKKLQKNWLP